MQCILTDVFSSAVCLAIFTLFINPPHADFMRIFLFGGWMLLCKEPTMAENSAHRTMQHLTTFIVALVFLLMRGCCDTAQAEVRWLKGAVLRKDV